MAERKSTLTIATKTEGGDDIKALVAQLQKLAEQGGAAAPELKELAAEIQRLDQAKTAADAFVVLKEKAETLGKSLSDEKERITGLRSELDALKATTAEVSSKQTQAAYAFDSTKGSVAAAKDALKLYTAEMRDAGNRSAEVVAEKIRLKAAAQAEAEAHDAAKQALKDANAELNKAVAAEKAQESAVNGSERAIRKLEAALEKQSASYNAASDVAKAFGVDTERVSVSQERLGQALNTASQSAQRSMQKVESAAKAEAEALRLVTQAFDEERAAEEAASRTTLRAEMAIKAQETRDFSNYIRVLENDLKTLTGTERQVAQSRLDEALRQQAIAAQKAATYEMGLAAALDKVDAAAAEAAASLAAAEKETKDAANAAKQAGNLMHDAFAVVGVRSANAIQAEILEIQQSLMRLASSSKTTGVEFDRAFASGTARIEQLRAELTSLPNANAKVAQSVNVVTAAMKQLALVYSGIELAQKFIQANIELQRNERVLKTLTGSAAAAAAEMNFVRQAANNLGVSVNDLTHDYSSLLAASKATALEGEATRQIFMSVSNALGQVGASSYATSRAFTAITQMVSKGVVSMEEMRQQLGEALPGAFQAAARGAGISEQALMELISSGELMTKDFLPALARGLDETFTKGSTKIEGFEQSWNRMKQTITDTSTFIGNSGLMKGAADLLDMLGNGIKYLTVSFESFGKKVGVTMGYLDEVFKHPIDATIRFREELARIDSEASDAFAKAFGGATRAAKGQEALADAAAKSGAAVAASGQATTAATQSALSLADAQKVVATNASATADSLLKAAQATLTNRNAATGAADNIIATTAAYAKAIAKAEELTKASEKLAEAKKLEGEASLKIASITGSEVDSRVAAASSADGYRMAVENVLIAKERELTLMQQEMAAIAARRAVDGSKASETKAELDGLNAKIVLKQAEIEKTKEATFAAAAEAAQLRIQAQSYVDNSAKVGQFAAALADAQAQVVLLTDAVSRGLMPQSALTQAQIKAAEAAGFYKDAVNDAVAASQREGQMSIQTAAMSGNEALQRKAATDAANNQVVALARVTQARASDVAMTVAQINALKQQEAEDGNLSAANQALLQGLQQKLAMQQQAVVESNRAVTAAKMEAEQARLNAEVVKDHSKYVLEYAMASQRAQQEVNALVIAEKEGRASSDDVAQARIRAAGATRMYVDALKDAVQAEEFKLNALSRDAQMTNALLNKEMAHAQALERVAQAHGDEAGVIRAKLMQKEIELKMVEATIAAKRAEAAQIDELVEKMRKEAEMDGIITAAEQEQMDARAANAAAIRAEADASAELVAALREEMKAQKEAADSSRMSSGSRSTSSSSSWDNGSSSGNSNWRNNNNTNSNSAQGGAVDLIQMMYAMGVSIEDAQAARQYIDDAYKQSVATSTPGESYKTINERAIQNALDMVRRERRKSDSGSSGAVSANSVIGLSNGNRILDPNVMGNLLQRNPLSSAPNQRQDGGSQSQQNTGNLTNPVQPPSTQPVTININGQPTTLNVGSMGDVSALENILRNLTQAANRT